MNGFLLSKYGRMYLNHKIPKNTNNNNRAPACPRTGTVTKPVAVKLLQKYMKEGVSDTQKNLNAFMNNNSSVTIHSGGTMDNVKYIYDNLGFTDECYSEITYPGEIKKYEGYTLSHAYIFIRGHAITGLINRKNEFYIYDSNGPYIKLNWAEKGGTNALSTYAKQMYGFSAVEPRLLVTWIKTSVLDPYIKANLESDRKIQEMTEKQLSLDSELYFKRKQIIEKLNGIPLASFMRYLNKGQTSNNYWEKLNVSTINSKIKEYKRRQQNLAMAAYFRRNFKSPNGHKMNVNPRANTKSNISSKMLSEIRKGERNTRLFSLLNSANNKIKQAVEKRIDELVSLVQNGHISLEIQKYNTNKVKNAKREKEREIITKLHGIKNTVQQNTNTNAIKQARANLRQKLRNQESKHKNITVLVKN